MVSPLFFPPPPANFEDEPDAEIRTWDHYMRHSIVQLMECDQAYFLENWEESRGSKIEQKLCVDLGIPRMYEEEDVKYV